MQDWSTSPLVIPSWQRNGTTFTFYARQAGNNQASINYTTGCAGYRLAADEPTPNADEGLWVSPNPTTGKVVVSFRLAEQQGGTLSVVSESGKILQARPVVGTGRMQEESLELSGQPVGLYVVQLKSGSVLKTAKVLVR